MIMLYFKFYSMNMDSFMDSFITQLPIDSLASNLIQEIDEKLNDISNTLIENDYIYLKQAISDRLRKINSIYKELLIIGEYNKYINNLFYAAWVEKNFLNFIKEIIILYKNFEEAQLHNLNFNFVELVKLMKNFLMDSCFRISPFLEDGLIFVSDTHMEISENFIKLNNNITIVNRFKNFMLTLTQAIKEIYNIYSIPINLQILNDFFYLFIYGYYVSNNYDNPFFINSYFLQPNVWQTFLEIISKNKQSHIFDILEVREDLEQIENMQSLEEIEYLKNTAIEDMNCYAMITNSNIEDNKIYLLLKNQASVEKKILIEDYCILKTIQSESPLNT